MEKLTYKQAYNKIIQAYFRDEIQPNEPKFCFCGTLAGKEDWYWGDSDLYSKVEYAKMEYTLFSKLPGFTHGNCSCYHTNLEGIKNYEDALFAGMSAALDVLKEIHLARGEDVDEVPVFTKRLLTPFPSTSNREVNGDTIPVILKT